MSSHIASPHPYTHILTDCLSIIFSYHIQHVENALYFTKSDILFLKKFVLCWHFQQQVNVRNMLRKTRGKKLKLQYVSAKDNFCLDDATFKLFRGIRALDVSQMHLYRFHSMNVALGKTDDYSARFSSEALENLRGIEQLDISGCINIESASFVNLRGVKDLRIANMDPLDESALEHLRGIHRLDMSWCGGFTDAGMENLRGIRSLNISECTQPSDACFENFRGVHELIMSGESELMLTSAAFVNLRGIKVLDMKNMPHVTGDALKNLIGVERMSIGYCPQVLDSHLRYLTGVKALSLTGCEQITGTGLQFLRGIQEIGFMDTGITEHDDFAPLREATAMRAAEFSITEQVLRNLRRVKSFSAQNCKFSHDSDFENLANVEELNIRSSQLQDLTDDAFRHLRKLRKLTLFNCDGGKVTSHLLDVLPRTLESLHIEGKGFTLRDEDSDEMKRCLEGVEENEIQYKNVWHYVFSNWRRK